MKNYIPFNLNYNVKVKLTSFGREMLAKEQHSLPSEDKEGWSTWQMWVLMEILGQYLCMGMEEPFELNILIEQ